MKGSQIQYELLTEIKKHPKGITTAELYKIFPNYPHQAVASGCRRLFMYTAEVCCRGVVTHTPYGQFRRATLVLLYGP